MNRKIGKLRKITNFFRSSAGIAQLPLMIGLLIMAIAVPVATKLVQENQNPENRAYESPEGDICPSGYYACNTGCCRVGTAPTSPPQEDKPSTKSCPAYTKWTSTCACVSYAKSTVSSSTTCPTDANCNAETAKCPYTPTAVPTTLFAECLNTCANSCLQNGSTFGSCSGDGTCNCNPVPTATKVPTVNTSPTAAVGSCSSYKTGYVCVGSTSRYCEVQGDGSKVWVPANEEICKYGCDSTTGLCKVAPTPVLKNCSGSYTCMFTTGGTIYNGCPASKPYYGGTCTFLDSGHSSAPVDGICCAPGVPVTLTPIPTVCSSSSAASCVGKKPGSACTVATATDGLSRLCVADSTAACSCVLGTPITTTAPTTTPVKVPCESYSIQQCSSVSGCEVLSINTQLRCVSKGSVPTSTRIPTSTKTTEPTLPKPSITTASCTMGQKKCSNSSVRMECGFNEREEVAWMYFGCPTGSSCSNGTCVNASGTPAVKSCTGETNRCVSDYYRGYCKSNVWTTEYCQYGCTNGICDAATGCGNAQDVGQKKCSSDTVRMECGYNEREEIAWMYFGCPTGSSCKSGTCVNTSGTPVVKSCSGETQRCLSDFYRGYCRNNVWTTEYCANGCTNGVCDTNTPPYTGNPSVPTSTYPNDDNDNRQSTATPTSPLSCNGQPKPAEKCSVNGNLEIDPKCVNNVWDYNIQTCNQNGREEVCGGECYVCNSAGGSWTKDPSKCVNMMCTQCPAGSGGDKSKGDADCNGIIDVNDVSIWLQDFKNSELGTTYSTSWRADFDCNGTVDVNDKSIWRTQFLLGL